MASHQCFRLTQPTAHLLSFFLCESAASPPTRFPPHTRTTTRDGFFAECPSLCQVLFIGRSAKRLFAECHRESTRQTNDTRQRGGLPSAEHSANNNTRQRPGLPSVGHSKNRNTQQWAAAVNGRQPPLTLCRVSSPDTRQSGDLTSVIFWHSANHFFSTFDLQTFSAVLIQYLVLHVPMWHISRTFSIFL